VAGEFTRSLDLPHPAPSRRGTGRSEAPSRMARTILRKWSLDILVRLGNGNPQRFVELRTSVPGISARILSSQLKQLESHGLLYREVLSTRPPQVRYGLTERGLSVVRLGEPVLLFLRWADMPAAPRASGPTRAATPASRRRPSS
jgi:DNA-binding HxlR family transcriptional regulator